jgi:hypothetical protein
VWSRALLFLAIAWSLPVDDVHAQSESTREDSALQNSLDDNAEPRLQRSNLETSLFSADAPSLIASYREVLETRGLVDVLDLWCEGAHGKAAHNERGSEWYCSKTANPKGFPGGGSSHLRLFGNDTDLFALAVLADEITAIEAAMLARQLVRAFERQCPCRLGDNDVTYCYCKDVEVRVMQRATGLGLMVIDDMEQFLGYTLGLDPRQAAEDLTTELDP